MPVCHVGNNSPRFVKSDILHWINENSSLNNKHIETMTIEEVHQEFQKRGIKTDVQKIMNGIEQNVYPFGICIHIGDKREFEIYRTLFDKWVKERLK